MTRSFEGRWDVTATAGGDSFPLWFEITSQADGHSGRFQPRGGHAIAMDSVEIDNHRLIFHVRETRFEGVFGQDGSLTGTASGSSAFEWTAVEAPLLPASESPTWGDPIELFNGKDLTGWIPQNPIVENLWQAQDGVLVNTGKGANLLTEMKFSDFRLHAEVRYPAGSNSGIYLRGRYEIQVSDSHGLDPHSRQLGGVYGMVTPTTNAALPAGQWQVFDIQLQGRWVTVDLNGTRIIDHQEIPGITGGALDSHEAEPGPILLQGDHGEVHYRNMVLTPVAVP